MDFVKLLKDIQVGEWVAIAYTRDRVVATASTLAAAKQAAIDAGESQPMMMRVPQPYAQIL